MYGRHRRPGRRYVVAAAAVLATLLSVAGWFLHERNRTTEFGLTDALSVLRADRHAAAIISAPTAPSPSAASSTSAPAAVMKRSPSPPPALAVTPPVASPPPASPQSAFPVPAAGVYTYATSGYDAISVGSRHTYPSETYAVLHHDGGCSWDVEHHVVDQHVDRIARCSQAGDVLRVSDASQVTFFGQTDGLTYMCDPPAAVVADTTCTAADGSQARYHATVVDQPTVSVGDVTRPAIHLLLDITMTGRARGQAHNQLWLDAATGLILRQIRDVDTLGRAAFGDVRYTEHAEFVLQSVNPQQ